MPSHADIHMLPVDDKTPQECAELQNFAYWQRVKRACDAELEQAGFVETPLHTILSGMAVSQARGVDQGGAKGRLSQQYVSDQLDWAMNIRQATSWDWATCLQLAEVFLYG